MLRDANALIARASFSVRVPRSATALALAAALSGCGAFGDPFNGFAGFIGDTHSIYVNANRPIGDSENLRRAKGEAITVAPLETESGVFWPGPTPPEPTLEDIQRQQNQDANNPPPTSNGSQPGTPNQGSGRPSPRARGSSSPPEPGLSLNPLPPTPGPGPTPNFAPSPVSPSFATPQGPAIANPSNGGVQTFTAPNGGTGIVVPNGNGTNTLIGPDGSVTTVPSRR